ncbi:hypothetical protein RclHR1_04010012 [Rhizophagus clarus]|uniref:Protein kinase domain-containing protein n=1 Tax=Rhizophagus clarus TaxID=94130 RepID=A0A2Z6RRV4_9GLOM|nr:hypothetical protein RclHR1_04010012 [Rhizophagus clarus]
MHEIIEQCVKEKHLKYYEYSEFIKIEEISDGLVNKVYRANWIQNEMYLTLKSFCLNNITAEEIINELKFHQKVDFNDKVIKFYGITKTNSVFLYIKIPIKLADFGLCKHIRDASQILLKTLDTIPYIGPEDYIITRENLQDVNYSLARERQIEKLKKSDIYSIGVLFWELSSGKKPFINRDYDLSLAKEIEQRLREEIVEGTPERFSVLYSKCWDRDPDKRLTIQEVDVTLESMMSRRIIQEFKLNHGLYLSEDKIESSKEAISLDDGVLNISTYKGQPLVYTLINNQRSIANLLSFNSNGKLNETLQFSNICINFPITEITYTVVLSESFSNFTDNNILLYQTYGHLFASKVLIGGRLFIDDLKPATLAQTDMFKSLIKWVYDSVKFNEKRSLKNLPFPNFFLNMRTSDGKNFNTPDELFNWLNNLYQKNMAGIISYNNLIPITELGSKNFQPFDKIQPGIANFKERNSKKISIEFNNIPNIYSSNKSYLEIVKPTTSLEKFVTLKNNFSIRNVNPFPFTDDYIQFRVKCEEYKILFNKDDIKPTKEFNQAIENALESMKPFTYLQDVFDEYGHFFPLCIYLGKSLKNSLPIFSFSSDISVLIDVESPTLNPLELYLDKFNISNFLTQEGNIIEKKNIKEWIHKSDDSLEIIEFDKLIYLYEILESELKRKVEIILNIKDSLKIILTGIDELKDLDDISKSDQIFKQINIEPSLEDTNYEVLGSIITKDNSKKQMFDLKECYILWMIIGNPLKLSVFSPKNQDFQVDYFSITLKPNQLNYRILKPILLSQNHTLFFKVHSTNDVYRSNIKLINWSYNFIDIEITKPSLIYNEMGVYIISSGYKNNNTKKTDCSLDLIGYCLTKNNFVEEPRMVVRYANFLPLISIIERNLNDIVDITQKVEYNERICNVLKQRVYAVYLALIEIKYFGQIDKESFHMISKINATNIVEWAEYGNLREFYTNYKKLFNLKLKLRIALDDSCGLNFLNTVKNIYITLNYAAKLGDFHIDYALPSENHKLERTRHFAPEILMKTNYPIPCDDKYKFEVYSFGILLWEIAEERIPYHFCNNVPAGIIDLVCDKLYQEPFSEGNQIPKEYKRLAISAINYDPEFSINPNSSQKQNFMSAKSTPIHTLNTEQVIPIFTLQDLESFKCMTLAEASNQHKILDKRGKSIGNIKAAYKCFEVYANLNNKSNQMVAKYYKAYYISKGFVESPQNKDKIVADLFKEVADDELNIVFPDANLRYGHCLYNGEGVEQNYSEALKYFERAAEDGINVAMYNAAAYINYEPAIKFCKEHNI